MRKFIVINSLKLLKLFFCEVILAQYDGVCRFMLSATEETIVKLRTIDRWYCESQTSAFECFRQSVFVCNKN